MKKYIALASALALALTFTACHDDDDDDDDKDYVADFTTINSATFIPGLQNASNYAGLNSFMLSDKNGYTDVYSFTTSSVDTTQFPMAVTSEFGNGWQGGITPTWFSATDEESYFTPASGAFHSGTGALICNPGTIERAIFSKHFAIDFSTALAYLNLGDIEGLYVAPTDAYNYLTTEEGRKALGITNPSSAVKIQFCVYGYIDSFRFSNLKQFISTIKGAAASIGKGGTISSKVIDLATFDGTTWTVNKDWQYLDLDDLDDYYLFEGYIRVVDSNNKTTSAFAVSDDNMLNYCLIDDITWESKSLF